MSRLVGLLSFRELGHRAKALAARRESLQTRNPPSRQPEGVEAEEKREEDGAAGLLCLRLIYLPELIVP